MPITFRENLRDEIQPILDQILTTNNLKKNGQECYFDEDLIANTTVNNVKLADFVAIPDDLTDKVSKTKTHQKKD